MTTPLSSTTLAPRFYETDGLGHINNVSIAGWLEVSRMSFLGPLGKIEGMSPNDWALVSVKIDYLAETFFGADVELRVTDVTVGNSSLTIQSEIWQNGSQTVAGNSTLVHFDSQTKQSKRLPEALRERLA